MYQPKQQPTTHPLKPTVFLSAELRTGRKSNTLILTKNSHYTVIMSTDNNDMCVNCGKSEEESISLKACTGCKMVKYCSRDCQKAHRPQHKKVCKKRAAELHDEALFKQPPPREDCPICFLNLPSLSTGWKYNICCGKVVCSGCVFAGVKMDGNADQSCPFCRTPAPETDDEVIKRVKKRVKVDDALSLYELGCCYGRGLYGSLQDHAYALELWHRSAELDCALAYYAIANAYWCGESVERNERKANHYYQLAAIGGSVEARHNLGNAELRAGSVDRALKHYMIAVKGGHDASVKLIQHMHTKGHATKDDYAKALKAYQAYLEDIKSEDRDKAAAFNDMFRYY